MKTMIYFKIALFFLPFSICLGETAKYKELKSKISHLEDSVIQDFNVVIPKGEEHKYSQDLSDAAKKLEVKYELQKKLLYKIEEKYFHLNNELDQAIVKKVLSEEEAIKLTS